MDEFIVSRDTNTGYLSTGESVIILSGPLGVECNEEFEGQVGIVIGSGSYLVRVSACRKDTSSPEDWVYPRRFLAKKLPICASEDIEMSEFINSF